MLETKVNLFVRLATYLTRNSFVLGLLIVTQFAYAQSVSYTHLTLPTT